YISTIPVRPKNTWRPLRSWGAMLTPALTAAISTYVIVVLLGEAWRWKPTRERTVGKDGYGPADLKPHTSTKLKKVVGPEAAVTVSEEAATNASPCLPSAAKQAHVARRHQGALR